MSSPAFDIAQWQSLEQYKKLRLPPSQAIGLALSILLVIGLAAAVCVMHRALRRDEDTAPWKPRKSKMNDPNAISS